MTKLTINAVKPEKLQNLTVNPSVEANLLEWDSDLGESFKYAEIWSSETNDRSTASLVGRVATNFWTHTGLTAGTTYYYWIRAANKFGRSDGDWEPDSATSGVSATPTATSAQINDGDVTTSKIANNAVTYQKAAPGTGVFVASVINAVGTGNQSGNTWADIWSYTAQAQDTRFILNLMGNWTKPTPNVPAGETAELEIRIIVRDNDNALAFVETILYGEFDSNGIIHFTSPITLSKYFHISEFFWNPPHTFRVQSRFIDGNGTGYSRTIDNLNVVLNIAK